MEVTDARHPAMYKSPKEQNTVPAIIPRESCQETLVEEGRTGPWKANQKINAIIPAAVNDRNRGGTNGLQKESYIRDLEKGAIEATGPTGERKCDGERTPQL